MKIGGGASKKLNVVNEKPKVPKSNILDDLDDLDGL